MATEWSSTYFGQRKQVHELLDQKLVVGVVSGNVRLQLVNVVLSGSVGQEKSTKR